jgi:hypothetical protein
MWVAKRAYLRGRHLAVGPGDDPIDQVGSGSGATDFRVGRSRSKERERKGRYLRSPHLFVHAAESALHCATQAPDSPQFFAHEKPSKLQIETHFATVNSCAIRSFSARAPTPTNVVTNTIEQIAKVRFMARDPHVNVAASIWSYVGRGKSTSHSVYCSHIRINDVPHFARKLSRK